MSWHILMRSQDSPLTDWLERSNADGVKWSVRFNNYESVAKNIRQGNRDINYPTVTNRWNATGGIMGDGCLEIWTPDKNTYPYEADGQWMRPFACFPGDRGYADEINAYKAGQELFDISNRPGNTNFLGAEWAGGFYAHPDYRTGGSMQQSWADQLIGTANDGITEFYVQYRVKFSSNRFSGTYNGSTGIRIPGSKFFRVEGRCTGTPHQEIVMTGSTSAWNWTPRFTMYSGTTWPGMHIYGEQGNSTSDAQPGNEHGYVCNYNTNPKFKDCWNWTPYANQWMTILLKVKMGHHTPMIYTDVNGNTWDASGNSSQQDGWLANSPYKDTAIAVWIAPFGGTYEKIWDKSNYVYWFDGNYPGLVRHYQALNATAIPWGWNWMRFDAFTGGTSSTPSDQEYYHWYDQLIFSTKFINCPRPGA